MSRIRALLAKELADLRQNPGVFVPAIFTSCVALALPFIVAIVVPAMFGEGLADSGDVELAREVYRTRPAARALGVEGAIQVWVFERFLVMLAMSPVAVSMSVAAYSVIGEKQARTLEPLLATPITTVELLAAKVLASFLPALALAAAVFGCYLLGIQLFARPGVARTLIAPQPLAIMLLLTPLAALASLQLAVCASARANDARSAQQIASLILLPLAGLLVLQLMGAFDLTTPPVIAMAIGLAALNAALMWIAVVVFDRESILTRWK
ncbi:MAG TPA: ABC transporter permease [Vicinamibacterales bacterium]|nr:ABC transporter permease [Vicinamibacterales bacterium]